MAKSRRILAAMAQERGMVLVQLVIDIGKSAYSKKTAEKEDAEVIDVLMRSVPQVGELITIPNGKTLKVKGVRHSIPRIGECITIVRVG
jgi:hypothetical protein